MFPRDKLWVELFESVEGRAVRMGMAVIRFSKLYFLRNNHRYNGDLVKDERVMGQIAIGFKLH